MSRLTLPYMSQDQGCFCCGPTAASHVSCLPQMRVEGGSTFPSHVLNRPVRSEVSQHKAVSIISNKESADPACLNTLMQNIHLHGQSEVNNKAASISFKLNQDEASPVESKEYDPSQLFEAESTDMKINFRSLQSRQLGNKFHSGRSYLSTSAPIVGMSRINIESPSSTSSHQMDLDQALDELDMLSTVTKSRREYLLEMRGTASAMKRERRLRSKSESSPNLSSFTRLNGFRVVQFDSNYVTSVYSSSSPSLGLSTQFPLPTCDLSTPPVKSQPRRMEYRNVDLLETSTLARRRRSVPRMSRLRTARYWRLRCPYKVPNRLCHSMQEGDFDLEGFQNYHQLFSSSTTSLPDAARDQPTNQGESDASVSTRVSSSLSSSVSQQQSKSNTNSPIKPFQDQPLVRSQSVEDLHTVPLRKLALLFDVPQAESRKEEAAHFEQIASQFTDLHMS